MNIWANLNYFGVLCLMVRKISFQRPVAATSTFTCVWMPEFGKKLGQILLEQEQISAPKLRLALRQQTLHPCPLGELLVSEKTVSHYSIAEALVQQQGLKHVKPPISLQLFLNRQQVSG